MDHFCYQDNTLYAEQVPVSKIAAAVGTPTYIYSRATLTRHYQVFDQAFADHPHKICYAVKANSNLAVLNILARLGSGFDIVSLGELERVLIAGGNPNNIVYSGVGKQPDEIKRALEVGIYCFNVESLAELTLINQIAEELTCKANVALRINPDIDAKTHPYIATGLKENKFGIAFSEALSAYQYAQQLPHLTITGIDSHIGSQLTELEPFLAALEKLLDLIKTLKQSGIQLEHIDIGGGLGITYRDEKPPTPDQQAQAIIERLQGMPYEIILEPGRAIAGNAGILVTSVLNIKQQTDQLFAVVDAGMNDLLRPALYQAWQDIIPVHAKSGESKQYHIVGPVCESGDFLGKDRALSLDVGDLLAVRSSGAYGFCMSSNYNSRTRAAEVMVDGDQFHLIRRREQLNELWQHETMVTT